MEIIKKCNTCKKEKLITEFSKSNRFKDGLQYSCKACEVMRIRKWVNKNKSKVKLKQKEWRLDNQSKIKNYCTQTKAKYRQLKNGAHRRNIQLLLNIEQYSNIIKCAHCYYCGDILPKTGYGLDRIDSNIGYQIDNVRTCCSSCNTMKLNHTENSFLIQIQKIYVRLLKRS